jgi:hypothetical protein
MCAVSAAAALLLAGPVGAQTHGGTGVLKIKPGARATGMGQAGVAVYQRAHSLWWNPAFLSDVEKTEVSSTVAQLVPDLASDVYYLNLGYATRIEGFGGFGVDFMYLSYGKTEATNPGGESFGFFSSYEFAPVVGAGVKLLAAPEGSSISDIDAGMAVKFVLVDLAPEWAMRVAAGIDKDGRATAFGVDMGLAVRGRVGLDYCLGMNVQNVGSDLVYIRADQGDPLPRNLKLGLALRFLKGESLSLVGAFDINKALIRYPEGETFEGKDTFGWSQAKELLNSGAELTLQDRLHVRLGYVHDPEGEIQAMTFGAGLDVNVADRVVFFDYSSVPQALDLDRVSYLSIGVQ